MTESINYREGVREDLPVLQTLLKGNLLPFEDLTDGKAVFWVATHGEEIIGCIGLEKRGSHGLLRSFAVKDGFKNKGIGDELFNKLKVESRNNGIETLHLLTTTANAYFEKRGFMVSNRDAAPDQIRQTTAFTALCPSTAFYMTRGS